jgi:thiol-disulfide isomerase/thioredoxin
MKNNKSYGIAASLFFIMIFVVLSGCTSDNSNNNANGPSWMKTYTPVHSMGSGPDDFWITYPMGHPNSSQSVDHLPWVLASLNKSCVVIVVHRTGCTTCQPQADRVIALAEKYKENVTFYDLDISLGGETEQKAYEAYVYDPAGPPGYIALTILVTLTEVNGHVEYCWHSWEGNVADAELEGWVQDTIYYYHVNSGT